MNNLISRIMHFAELEVTISSSNHVTRGLKHAEQETFIVDHPKFKDLETLKMVGKSCSRNIS